MVDAIFKAKEHPLKSKKKFSKDNGGDIMDMECTSRRSENEVENEHRLRVGLLETACNMKTSSSNLK